LTRLVIDTSVLLSAAVAAPDTPLSQLMGAVQSGAAEMVVCDQLLDEVERGLENRYFRKRLTDEERKELRTAIARVGLHMPDPVAPQAILRDPKDDYLVALAKAADAAVIVTGDRDLLDHSELDPPAINAREACVRIGLLSQ
jgi:putative PIN family toxin of toxin-antitoxin system